MAQGLDPSAEKQRAKAERRTANANTFGAIAREWHALKSESWDPPCAKAVMRRMELDLLPDLDTVPITQITTPILIATLRKMEARGALDLLRRTRQYHSRATVHGVRGTASTILNENGFNPDAIEVQQTRQDQNKVRAAYNHAQYLKERQEMMQRWGNFLEKTGLRCGSGGVL